MVAIGSETAYWAAIKFEATHPPDPTDKEPSTTKRYAVAKYVLGLLKKQKRYSENGRGYCPWLAAVTALPRERRAATAGGPQSDNLN